MLVGKKKAYRYIKIKKIVLNLNKNICPQQNN